MRAVPARSGYSLVLVTGLAAVVFGLAGGIFAAGAPLAALWLGSRFDQLGWLGDYPALATGLAALGLLAFGVVASRAGSLWGGRDAVAIALVMVSLHVMGFGLGPVKLLNVVILILAGLWLLDRFAQLDMPIVRSPFRTMTVAMAALALASAVGHNDVVVFHGLLVFLPKLALAWFLVDLIASRGLFDWALRCFIWIGAASAAIGIGQAIVYFSLGYEWTLILEDDPIDVYLGGMRIVRSGGLMATTHSFGQLMAVCCAVAATLLLSKQAVASRLGLASVVVLGLAALILTFARSQWIGLGAALVAIPFLVRPNHAVLIGATALAAVVLLFGTGLAQYAAHSVLDISDRGADDRIVLLAAGLRALASHSVNGVGITNFGPYSPTADAYPVHNAPMQVASEMGFPALVLFVTILASVGYSLLKASFAAAEPEQQAHAKALLAGWIVIVVGIQLEPLATSEFVWVYLALCETCVRLVRRIREPVAPALVPAHGA